MAAPAQQMAFVDVPSDLFGTITVPEEAVLDFPGGVYGFEDCRHFIMVEAQLPGFFWLQSTERASLLFLLTDPFAHLETYEVEMDLASEQQLGSSDPDDVSVLAIVTLPRNAQEEATMNLQGPIAVNTVMRRGRQLVMADDRWGCRHPLALEPIRA
ncbi:MAG TPA: flagellar assembly protein FliW [Gemmatimonadales bacterium]|nr:flagellar assembly protein FliW [Gemmatimonadales bacterium]